MAYTTIDDPEAYFQTKIYTGNATDETAITLDGDTDMQPDLIWIKDRDAQQHHRVMDSVRGLKQILRSDSNDSDLSSFPLIAGSADGLHSIDSDGFTLTEDDSDLGFNGSGSKTVAWCWKANGSGSSNSNGSITSTVSASTDAGFSIVSWSGSGANATIGHGLGAEPKMIFLKIRTAGNNWQVYNKSIGSGNALYLNNNEASESNTGWQSTDATSSVFSVSDGTAVNGSGASLIAYCFADVQGYSKFGSYEGNGDADGTFVFLGFRPAFVMVKPIDAADNWVMFDNKRLGFNSSVSPYYNYANQAYAETTDDLLLEFLSNGFKIRDAGNTVNRTSTFIYMAFAEAPFVNSNGVPNNAR
jgi:hypothetical protein